MKTVPDFVTRFEKEGRELLKLALVEPPLFSRGTYQFEVREGKKKYFPFLQIKEIGEIGDAFCSCEESEKGEGCPHLAASFLFIFQEGKEPLHVRFEKSFWNALFQIEARRNGFSTQILKSVEGGYCIESKPDRVLFSISAKNAKAQEKLQALIEKREEETESTSIKFSNLSQEELAAYREGNPSFLLSYELSFWSDLAKWLLFSPSYEIAFEEEKWPKIVKIQTPALVIQCYISEAHLPELISTLNTVNSPLKLFDDDLGIESIHYDPTLRSLVLSKKKQTNGVSVEGKEVGEFIYVKNEGFYRKVKNPLFEKEIIPPEKMAQALQNLTVQKYVPIEKGMGANYHLFFDKKNNFHIELYLFESGDLRSKEAALFPPFVFLPGRGFFQVKELMFEGIEKVIAKEEMSDFITRHRIWLHHFPGFQTHLGSLESHLTYTMNENGLLFEAKLDFPESFDEMIDFHEWVFIKGSGFYMKKESRGRLPLHPGLFVEKERIGNFIAEHIPDLEQVQSFFLDQKIIQRSGLVIEINAEGKIVIVPQVAFAEGVDPANVQMFKNYAYWKGKGFSEIPAHFRLPEKFSKETVIAEFQESPFLAYEFEALKPFILSVDPRLTIPDNLRLKIRKIQKDRRSKMGGWWVDFIYESEIGSVDVFAIWDALGQRKKHIFSNAGFISLKDPRFQWLKGIQKRKLDRKKGQIKLSTLEWIRLSIFEEILEPKGSSPEAIETRTLLEEIRRFETHQACQYSLLNATLRPYQELGLQWLWFLYCHGLSGLLCDDMGLGKTHQTMALLAAIIFQDPSRSNKYLVVCPTSVIYHWQELLKKFLPALRVCTYYGMERTIETFETDYDLLLTSYGILRTGKSELKTIFFECAVFDEIQIAKNSASQTHRALRQINAKMKLGLTGTPIENRLQELKSLFDIVLPNYLPPDASFREIFIHPIEKFQDEEKKRLLSKLIKPFILRRKKSEVLFDLPEKIEEIAYCDLTEDQKKLYIETSNSIRNTVYAELKDESKPVSYLHVFSALNRLKQICDHPSIVLKKDKDYKAFGSGKWDLFVELLQEARNSGQKVVIFSQYLDMLALIEEYLKEKGIGFATIKGSTRNRSEQLLRFREDPDCFVFTASLLAAGIGIDLTVASVVIHYDRWWNPAKENQATDRVHRIGQNRGVQVFKLVTKNTVEEHIHELIEKKKGLLEEIVGEDELDSIHFLNREELIQVFETIFKDIE